MEMCKKSRSICHGEFAWSEGASCGVGSSREGGDQVPGARQGGDLFHRQLNQATRCKLDWVQTCTVWFPEQSDAILSSWGAVGDDARGSQTDFSFMIAVWTAYSEQYGSRLMVPGTEAGAYRFL